MSSDALHFNKVTITGTLSTEPQQRQTDGGATSIFFKIRETRTGNIWHCRAFDRIASFVLDNVDEEHVCLFEGRLEQQPWEDGEGRERRSISIRVTRVHTPVFEDVPVITP